MYKIKEMKKIIQDKKTELAERVFEYSYRTTNGNSAAASDRQYLIAAAEYFEEIATMGNPVPVAFAQAIRRTVANAEEESS